MARWHTTIGSSGALLRFDRLDGYESPRLDIVWLENTLDCRTWTYYCDLKDAMSRLHRLCIPRHSVTCVEGRGLPRGFKAQVVVAGPRYMANVAHIDETLGFDRGRFAHLPLAVVQNKMYAATAREIVGDASAKLRWARDAGAIVGFTWLKLADNFTQQSGVPHYRLPFGVDAALYGRHAGTLESGPGQPVDVGFTGASNHKYPLREAILGLVRSMNVSCYLGTWQQTSLRVGSNNSWKALDRDGYVQQIAKTKMWVSTTGPSDIVGTRYFEILASGTTLLLCNQKPGAYEGLFEDGVHAVVFDGMDDLRAKILHYLQDEPARRRIVRAAAALAHKVHSWDARARFITRAFELHVAQHEREQPRLPYFVPQPPLPAEPYVACLDGRQYASAFTEVNARRPLRRFTVATCALACRTRNAAHFGLQCGGFCSGNGHRLGRCFCAKSASTPALSVADVTSIRAQRPRYDCASTCSLQDARPCGGFDAMALFSLASGSVAYSSASPNVSSSGAAGATAEPLTRPGRQGASARSRRAASLLGIAPRGSGRRRRQRVADRGQEWNFTQLHEAAAAGDAAMSA